MFSEQRPENLPRKQNNYQLSWNFFGKVLLWYHFALLITTKELLVLISINKITICSHGIILVWYYFALLITIYNWELKLRFLHKIKRARIVSFFNQVSLENPA